MLVDLLIVEDDGPTRLALAALFRNDGWTIRTAATLAEARAAVAVDRPRAIILDLRLPDGSGLDFLREVRAAAVPSRVVVATAVHEAGRDDAEALGADDVICKPVDVPRLLASVRGTEGT